MTGPRLSLLAVSPVGEAGGAEVLLLGVLAGLAGAGPRACAGVEPTLLVLGDGPLADEARSRGLRVAAGPGLSFKDPVSVARCAAFVRRVATTTQPHVVLASHAKGQVIAQLALAGRRPRVAHVTQLYDPPPPRGASARVAGRLPGIRLAITEETAAAHRRRYRDVDPIVIPPGVDRARLAADAAAGTSRWRDAGPAHRIAMVGRLQRFKGPFDLLELARRLPGARFLVIGPDSPMEPGLRSELQADIDRRHLTDRVELAGRLTAADLAATVRDATLLVHPAHHEPYGLVVAEALCLGTPAVAYAAPGPAAILRQGGGTTVPVADVDALAAAVSGALADAETLARWRAEAAAAAPTFDLAAHVERYRSVLWEAAAAAGVLTAPALRQ